MEHLTVQQRTTLKEKLEARKKELEEQLSRIATQDPDTKGNWKAVFEDMGEEWDDKVHEVAEHDIKTALEQSLELHLQKVRNALKRLKDGNYGMCEVDGKPIEPERLMVMPETTQCQEHSKS